MKTWSDTVRRELWRFEKKVLAACDSSAVHKCQRRRSEESDSATKTLRLVFDVLQAELHEFVGITPVEDLDDDKVETATFAMEDSIRGFRNTVVGAWTIRRVDDGIGDADREVVFNAIDGARRELCRLAVRRAANRDEPREARVRKILSELYRRAYHLTDHITSDRVPESEFADTIEQDIDNALAAVIEEVSR